MINNLPNLIRAYLKETGMTQRDLAKAAGIDEAILSRLIHSNRQVIDLDKANALRAVIGFHKEDLLLEVESA